MKKTLILALLLLLMLSLLIGCSDDDDPIAVADTTYIIGQAYLNPDPYFYADFIRGSENETKIDSVLIGDISVPVYDSYWYVYADNNYYYTHYDAEDNSLGWSSGDTIDIHFYKGADVAHCYVKILENSDYPQYITPATNDTIALGDPLELIWNNVENAEWYGIGIYYYQDSAGTEISKRIYGYTTDTAYTLPGTSITENGYFNIYVESVTGPLPSARNIMTNTMTGVMHSSSSSQYMRTYAGTGSTNPIMVQENPDDISREILKNILMAE